MEITRTVLEEHILPGGSRVLQLILVTYPPGAQSPAHTHPTVGLIYILSGEAESQYEGEPVRRFRGGDTYQDPAGKTHLLFRNTSATEPLRFLIAAELTRGDNFVHPLVGR